MEQKNVQAQFQMQDSFVKNFNINIIKKVDSKDNFNVNGKIGFSINDITEDDKKYIGEIELINEIKIVLKDKECVNIHISMVGLFIGMKSGEYNKDKFEEMLKYNGATTLSHLIRAYVYTVTGLSGIPQISTPMINFVEFFKNAKEKKEENN